MSIYVPLYRPTRAQESHLHRQQILKRRRQDEESDDEHEVDPTSATGPSHPARSSTSTPRPSAQLATSKTDPYHVAGHSRHSPLPRPPFPHGPVKLPSTHTSAEAERTSPAPPGLPPPSPLKRHHIDNLTALLHSRLLQQDWPRARRAWELLLRTELGGQGPDLRAHGRWGIGAEVLLRGRPGEPVSARGAPAAREYLERLVLQYPCTRRRRRGIDAATFYPALFGLWVWEVQSRCKRRRVPRESGEDGGGEEREEEGKEKEEEEGEEDEGGGDPSGAEERRRQARRELRGATAIAERLDEVLARPPHDSSVSLVELRGMIGLWIADLHDAVAAGGGADGDARTEDGVVFDAERRRETAGRARERGVELLHKARGMGATLPAAVSRLLHRDDGD